MTYISTTASAQDTVTAILLRAAHDRVWFVKEVLGVTYIEPWQEEVLRALDKGVKRISIRSGHGVGKTCLCAWIILHFILTRNNVKIPVTAPSAKTMDDGLIPEVNKWIRELPAYFEDQLHVTDNRIERKDDGFNNFVSFRTARADAPEALAGIHSDHVLAVVDEASGVPDVVYENAAGTMSTPGAIFILIGNPTRPKGYFHKTQTTLKHRWWTRKVGSADSTRVDHAFIEEIIAAYGLNSPQYRVRVLGEFPLDDLESLIPYHLLESALGRDIVAPYGARRVWGLDPGRGGDPTGFIERTDYTVTKIAQWGEADTMLIVGRLHTMWNSTPALLRPEHIYTDSIGLGGPIADRLRELGLPAVDVAVSEASSLKNRYPRLRAELWWKTREWFESMRVGIPADLPFAEQLIDELSEPKAIFTTAGKDDVETKAAMKARGIPSPNLADALVTSFAYENAVGLGRQRGEGSDWNKPLDHKVSNVH